MQIPEIGKAVSENCDICSRLVFGSHPGKLYVAARFLKSVTLCSRGESPRAVLMAALGFISPIVSVLCSLSEKQSLKTVIVWSRLTSAVIHIFQTGSDCIISLIELIQTGTQD